MVKCTHLILLILVCDGNLSLRPKTKKVKNIRFRISSQGQYLVLENKDMTGSCLANWCERKCYIS